MQIDSVSGLLKGITGELVNWPSTAPVGLLCSPSRYLPSWNPLARGSIGGRTMMLRLRNGLEIECQANEFPPFLEVFVTGGYDLIDRAGIEWPKVRQIVDIGANVGMATLWFSKRAPNAQILAVEPSRKAFKRLTVNVARNDLLNRVTMVREAVSDTAGEGVLASHAGTADGRLVASGAGETVTLTTLSALLGERGIDQVDILKLDCEGAEFAILESAPNDWLSRIRCIVGEYHRVDGHTSSELVGVLRAAGFEVTLEEEVPEVGILLAFRQ